MNGTATGGPRLILQAEGAVLLGAATLAYSHAGAGWGMFALLCLLGWAALPMALALGLIWLAHVGFDRMAGYGLKYGDAFRHTHLSGQAVTTHGAA
jgi:Domain of unknown function (DUF4260)